MFGLFKRNKKAKEAKERELFYRLPVSVDIHSHLIPGIDDGSQEMKKSLILLQRMSQMGYKKVVTTPHVMADSYTNSTYTIMSGLDALKRASRRVGLDIEIEAGAEYYFDEELQKRLIDGDILTINREYLLFETSYYNQPFGLEDLIYEMKARGYTPLLAHPERYRYVKDKEKFYIRLKELGALFQINLNSIGGYYGQDAKEKVLWLIENGLVDFVGSDTHGIRHLDFIHKTVKEGLPIELIKRNRLLNDTLL